MIPVPLLPFRRQYLHMTPYIGREIGYKARLIPVNETTA
jgi:hypothetical protein